MTLEVFVI